MERDQLSGIILAGGRSSRMGTDKALLRRDGRTLLHRTVEVLGELSDDVIVVGRKGSSDAVSDARFVLDDVPRAGPLGGLLSGLRTAQKRYAVVVACDLPFLNADLLRYLAAVAPPHEAAVPRVGGESHPLHAVYARAVTPGLDRFLASGQRRARDFINCLDVRWLDDDELRAIDPDLRSLYNVNTPADWSAVCPPRRNVTDNELQ